MQATAETGGPLDPRCARLTRPQLAVLAALEDLIDELGYAPTYRQTLKKLGWSPNSKGALHRYLEQLRQLGIVEGRGRALRIVC